MKARRRETAEADVTGTPPRAHLLVVEDEQDLAELVRFNLERDGYRVSCADTGERALQVLRAGASHRPDLVLLDLMLPGMDGLEVCRAIRGDPELAALPVLMLTARSEESDVVIGLELGADDYLTKPFSPRVLLARVRALLRRQQAPAAGAPSVNEGAVEHNGLVIRPDRHEVLVEGRPIDLTATEFRLLQLLAARPGRVFTRQQIIEAIHGQLTAVTDRSVDVQVVMLRRKMGPRGQDVQTVRGVGYRLKE